MTDIRAFARLIIDLGKNTKEATRVISELYPEDAMTERTCAIINRLIFYSTNSSGLIHWQNFQEQMFNRRSNYFSRKLHI